MLVCLSVGVHTGVRVRERESINLFYNEDKIESRYGRVKDKNAIKWPFPFRRISKNGKNGLLGTICVNSLGIKDI